MQDMLPAKAPAAAKKIEESNESSDSESSDSEVFVYLPISKWKLHYLIEFLIIFLPDFTMSHFIGFQKPATEVKNSAVATAQNKNQELDGSDSDSDDSSDEVRIIFLAMHVYVR